MCNKCKAVGKIHTCYNKAQILKYWQLPALFLWWFFASKIYQGKKVTLIWCHFFYFTIWIWLKLTEEEGVRKCLTLPWVTQGSQAVQQIFANYCKQVSKQVKARRHVSQVGYELRQQEKNVKCKKEKWPMCAGSLCQFASCQWAFHICFMFHPHFGTILRLKWV